ncbi:transmembrane protein 53-A [Lepisosteus oculatus]|nr:PREDICTED: transmembrane protein 53-like [Lepisosteus oculatus]XP_015207650.1 PREDICTED: transmembrane protein 53-like [Lepisosteus oculatus]
MLSRIPISTGITAQRISKLITFYKNESKVASSLSQAGHKPVMLLLPWLGSRPQAVAKYCEIYFRTGLDVLVVESDVTQFLWPRRGLDHGAKVLELLQTDTFNSRPLLVHGFSIGGYTFAQIMVHVTRNAQQHQSLTNRIRGQIFDSLVVGSVEHMASGVGRSMFPRFEGLVQKVSLLYFSLFKKYTVDYYNRAIDVFWNNPVRAPALFFYCDNDPLSDCEEVERVTRHWEKLGIPVRTMRWKESVHAGHLKQHPQDYLMALDSFLQSLSVIPLKAKI